MRKLKKLDWYAVDLSRELDSVELVLQWFAEQTDHSQEPLEIAVDMIDEIFKGHNRLYIASWECDGEKGEFDVYAGGSYAAKKIATKYLREYYEEPFSVTVRLKEQLLGK